MRGCEAFDKGGSSCRSNPGRRHCQRGPAPALPYAWERIAFWLRQLLNRHARRTHRHPHAKERWGHAGIELDFFILPYHTATHRGLHQSNAIGHHEPVETLKLLIPDLEHELSPCVCHLKTHGV